MKKNSMVLSILAMFLVFILPGCSVIGDIFKAGVWTGFIIVGVILALVIYFIMKSRNK